MSVRDHGVPHGTYVAAFRDCLSFSHMSCLMMRPVRRCAHVMSHASAWCSVCRFVAICACMDANEANEANNAHEASEANEADEANVSHKGSVLSA